jgi:hypothetical protein
MSRSAQSGSVLRLKGAISHPFTAFHKPTLCFLSQTRKTRTDKNRCAKLKIENAKLKMQN